MIRSLHFWTGNTSIMLTRIYIRRVRAVIISIVLYQQTLVYSTRSFSSIKHKTSPSSEGFTKFYFTMRFLKRNINPIISVLLNGGSNMMTMSRSISRVCLRQSYRILNLSFNFKMMVIKEFFHFFIGNISF